MTKAEMIAEIRRLDPYYEDVPLEDKPFHEVDHLLDYVASDPENTDGDEGC